MNKAMGKGEAQQGRRGSSIRDDFVPADHYLTPDFLRLEKERMWPRVWQMACREEEIPNVGSYLVYDVMDESIAVVRTAEAEIKAFYNVCQHRGRRLLKGTGQITRFHCGFHGWQYDLDGVPTRIWDRDDWKGCPNFTNEDLSLKKVRVGTWGGWVFVCMDMDAEPLEKFLAPVIERLGPYEIEKMRYRWYVTVTVPCNWKVGCEAFNEGYHVAATHPQILVGQGDDYTRTETFGPHGVFFYHEPKRPFGAPTPRTGLPMPDDLRAGMVAYFDQMNRTLRAMFTERDAEAVRRLLTEVPKDTDPWMLAGKAIEFMREAAIATGAGWPDITMQQAIDAGVSWHVFPNFLVLPWFDGVLSYRVLPHPTNPDWCYFDVYSLVRYAPGAEPPLERQVMYADDDHLKFNPISPILQQDFSNMGEVQRGMKSRGFAGGRTNPKQETTVSNFHRVICDYINGVTA